MQLEKLITFQGRPGPLLLIVADGVGLAPAGPANAVSLANTPVLDNLLNSPLQTPLHAHGTHVGLPTDGDMGNSEVGHNTLGGGRIFAQGAKLVNLAMEDGTLFDSETWNEVETRGKEGQSVHFLGLLSDGNVHSHIRHLLTLLDRCVAKGVAKVRIHVLLDGRDVDPRSALDYLSQIENRLTEINDEPGCDYRVASGGGRMAITMDRYDADWAMVNRGFDTHVHGIGNPVVDARAEIQRQYDNNPEIDDQYLEPFVIVDDSGTPAGPMQDGDAVVLFNFRGDRAIEISRALESQNFDEFDRGQMPQLYFCGMLQYDGDLNVPAHYLVNPPVIERTMVEFMCAENLKTFAVSETQKFGHVTYFWNGNRSGYLDESLETYVEIPSDNIEFSHAPAMKATEITDATIELVETGEYRFGRINFANGDMVGHTGNIEATVSALETVDACIGRLIDAVTASNGIVIVTADHGNADEMFVEKNGEHVKRTSHTLNPVPFAIVDAVADNAYHMAGIEAPGLANVAATVFNLLGYQAPPDYLPSLIEFPAEPRGRRTIHKGSVVDLGLETAKLPNGEIIALEIVRHPGGAVVIPMNSQGEVCLIRQFRHAAGGWIWEFPAGILNPAESPEQAAIRELKEETGLGAGNWESLGSLLSTPGFCSERLHIFLATDLTGGEASPEQYEFIETHWLPLNQVEQMAHNGEIDDAKTIVALFRLKQKLN